MRRCPFGRETEVVGRLHVLPIIVACTNHGHELVLVLADDAPRIEQALRRSPPTRGIGTAWSDIAALSWTLASSPRHRPSWRQRFVDSSRGPRTARGPIDDPKSARLDDDRQSLPQSTWHKPANPHSIFMTPI